MRDKSVLFAAFTPVTSAEAQVNKVLRRKIEQLVIESFHDGASPVYIQPVLATGLACGAEVISEEPDETFSSQRVARGAVKYAKDIGMSQIYIIAEKSHIERFKQDVELAILEAGVDISVVLEEISEFS